MHVKSDIQPWTTFKEQMIIRNPSFVNFKVLENESKEINLVRLTPIVDMAVETAGTIILNNDGYIFHTQRLIKWLPKYIFTRNNQKVTIPIIHFKDDAVGVANIDLREGNLLAHLHFKQGYLKEIKEKNGQVTGLFFNPLCSLRSTLLPDQQKANNLECHVETVEALFITTQMLAL